VESGDLFFSNFCLLILLRDVPSETIYSQIGVVSGLLVQEADTLVKKACGFADAENSIPEDRVDVPWTCGGGFKNFRCHPGQGQYFPQVCRKPY